MIITVTEIKIKGVFGFLGFIINLGRIKVQLRNTDGLVFQKYKGLRTLTGWESEEAMKVFRNNGQHLNAMKNIKSIGWAKSVTWEGQLEPSWSDAMKKLHSVNFKR